MKINFDANQQYQIDAVNAVADVFDGQPRARGRFEVSLAAGAGGMFAELGVGNNLLVAGETLLENARAVQERNGISPLAETLDGLHFSVSMETGTGKTYIYLRTIRELHARYGFTKFVVVVPSVAIREGVLKNLRITEDHFRALYANAPCDYQVYDAARVSAVRCFASSNQLQILVMNIDAFNKPDSNVIHKENDRLSGRRPVEFVRAARPIVIVDEPQNMESEGSRAAIATLNPLCTLRYSATHRNAYTMLYKLDPALAYDLKLVKRIEVDSIVERADFNRPYIRVDAIQPAKDSVKAKLTIDVQTASGPARKAITVARRRASDVVDLYEKSGGRELYRGYRVDTIDARNNYVSFENGVTLDLNQASGARTDDVMRAQVWETVQEHLEKELRFARALPEGGRLKVLSLFFIDRVANYADADGKIRRWFEEAYAELAARERYAPLALPPVERVHNGYFAKSKEGAAKDTSGKTKEDEEAYALIMRDKERLLSREEPLRFIFSHSALREGWDNPNVFQICTLNETKSETRKRQEIGRGLRLPVDESGDRVFDAEINRLTVVANESYADFAKALQEQIEEETGVSFRNRIAEKRDRRRATLRENWQLHPEFRALWDRIRHRTRYSVEYDSDELIERAAAALRALPPIEPPSIVKRVDELSLGERGVTTRMVSGEREVEIAGAVTYVPDILGQLQRETELTRRTLAEILRRSGRLGDLLTNPQQFTDLALRAVRRTLDEVMAEGIRYETVPGQAYEMQLFEAREIAGYANRMVEVGKSVYDALEVDSDVEARFAAGLDGREDIRFFVKLPDWFKVDTPVGTYNPDWAIVKQLHADDTRVYLVRESKSTHDPAKRRPEENIKIHCGKAHFDALDGVEYAVATSVDEV